MADKAPEIHAKAVLTAALKFGATADQIATDAAKLIAAPLITPAVLQAPPAVTPKK